MKPIEEKFEFTEKCIVFADRHHKIPKEITVDVRMTIDYISHSFSLQFKDSDIKYFNQAEQFLFCFFHNLKPVPISHYKHKLASTINDVVAMSNGSSYIREDVLREGLVYRNYGDGNNGYKSFKVINPEYLLKHEE